jgi:NitT/TauT family transport system substrate-binding protein
MLPLVKHNPLLRGFFLFILTTLLIVACSPQQTSNSPSSPNSANTAKVLTVGTSSWPGYSSHFVAEAKGFFKAEGVEVKEVFFPSQGDSDSAFLAGKLDLNWAGLTGIVPQISRDPSIKVIYQGDYSNGSDGIIARNIKSGKDLQGKKIAREDILFEELILRRYLAQMGVSRDEVEVINMTADAAAAAFVANKVDVAITFEPWMTKSAKEGKGEVVFSTRDTNIVPDGITARVDLIKNHKPEIQAYLRAIDKATQLIKTNAPEVIDIVAKKINITAAEVPAQLGGVKFYDIKDNKTISFVHEHPKSLFNSLEYASKTAKEIKIITEQIDVKATLDASIVNSL